MTLLDSRHLCDLSSQHAGSDWRGELHPAAAYKIAVPTCVLLTCFQVVVAKFPFFFGLGLLCYLGREEKGAVEAGRERILDSDQFIECYQPAGRQPQSCWALPDLWLWENTTARGLREAETALFGLKLTGKSCVVAVRMDIFLSMAQMGVTSAGPEH